MNTKNNSGQTVFSYAEEGNLRFLKRVYAATKVAENDVAQLFEMLTETPTSSERYTVIVKRLKDLVSTKPYEFLHYSGLFAGLQKIIRDALYPSDEPVTHILGKICKMQHQKSILKASFEAFADNTRQNTDRMRKYVMIALGVIKKPIFDMPAILADDKPHVYALFGHACIYVDDKRIVVPPGVIWIENAFCGRYSYLSRIKGFIKADMKRFFEETPMPIDEESRSAYREFLYRMLPYYTDVKFPGDTIASGKHTFHGEMIDPRTSKPSGRFYKSGIQRLYTTDELNPELYDTPYLVEDDTFKTQANQNAFFSQVYDGSIYPTVEQVMNTRPTSSTYAMEFEDLFLRIKEQPYETGKNPLVLINFGCRTPCGADNELDRPALARANSIVAQKEIIRKLPNTDTLTALKSNGKTRLYYLIEEGIYEAAKQLVERLAPPAITPTEFLAFLCKPTQHGQDIFTLIKKLYVTTRGKDSDFKHLTNFIELKLVENIPKVDPTLLTSKLVSGQSLLHALIISKMSDAAKHLLYYLESRLSAKEFYDFLQLREYAHYDSTAFTLALGSGERYLSLLIESMIFRNPFYSSEQKRKNRKHFLRIRDD